MHAADCSRLENCESEYAMAGFPGCIGSTDATHIPLDKVTVSIRQAHIGYKLGSESTTRTYNLTLNRCRQILHSTTGHPGRWNDKTLVRFDSFMAELRNGAFDDMMDFTVKRQKKVDTALNLKDSSGICENEYELHYCLRISKQCPTRYLFCGPIHRLLRQNPLLNRAVADVDQELLVAMQIVRNG